MSSPHPCPKCGRPSYKNSAQCRACRYPEVQQAAPERTVETDREARAVRAAETGLHRRYKDALDVIDRQADELNSIRGVMQPVTPFEIAPSIGSSGSNEATAVFPWGDWHSEEIVEPERVNGRNAHNPEISRERSTKLVQNGLKIIRLIEAGVKVPHLVIPLLGDFCTNDIHDADNAESNGLLPVDAYLRVQESLTSNINFLLNHFEGAITLPCHSGNHARTTQKIRHASEKGHSLEYWMYKNLANEFRSEPRITFKIAEGYHSFGRVYGTTLRIHHGHNIKYGGGVGGLYIPVNKAIAQWNKVIPADIDVFGHFHQSRDGGNFISNGSLIGWNAYANSIKADFETPRQQLFVIDKKHGRTCLWPIYV